MRISPAVSVEFLYRDLQLKVPPRVDCTVLFAGPHLEQILTAYAEAVRLFSEIHEPAKLLERKSRVGIIGAARCISTTTKAISATMPSTSEPTLLAGDQFALDDSIRP